MIARCSRRHAHHSCHASFALKPIAAPLLALLALLSLLASAGCRQPVTEPPAGSRTVRLAQGADEDFEIAIDNIRRLDEFDPQQAAFQAAYSLNRWVRSQSPDPQWIADPLTGRLPSVYQGAPPLRTLSDLEYSVEDIQFLREVFWLRQISGWVSQKPPNEQLHNWLQTQREAGAIDAAAAQQLEVAERLFDWTIRNIQLDPLLPYPKQAAAGPSTGEEAPQGPPALRAEPGPGYTLYPWQVLLFGHGDAWQRARVFILLARQQGIEAVMLAVPDAAAPTGQHPWLPAVLLGEQLYLFDTQLGLPIPAEGTAGIATLAQVVEQPERLRALDVEGVAEYRVDAEQVQQVSALLDASPGYLAQRMRLIENNLSGEDTLVLSVEPSEQAGRLRQLKGISQVNLWALPYETMMFRYALPERLEQDAEARQEFIKREGLFQNQNPLLKARQQHFRGIFENRGDEEGAKRLYLTARPPETVVGKIESSEDIQKQLGLERGQEDDAQWQERLRRSRDFYNLATISAAYWLGLVQYETGDYATAINWLDERTLDVAPDGTWSSGARYNLGRCYEQLGQPDKAREMYEAEDSPQRLGNLLRARRLP